MEIRTLIPKRSIWSLLLLISLLSCCGAIYPDHDHIDIDDDYLPNRDHLSIDDDYFPSHDDISVDDDYGHSNRDECALRMKRSLSSHTMDSFPENSHHFELGNAMSGDCIRYKDVNEALWKAKKVLGFVPGYVDPKKMDPDELDRIANLLIETTRNLAEKFQLTHDEINYGLPTIDTSKTDIWDICPAMYKPAPCTVSRFRTLDGSCSSLKNSVLGMALTPFKRYLPAQFADGISAPKVSPIDGSPLPHVRLISIKVHTDISQLTARRSSLVMSWGQFLGHDLLRGEFPREEDGTVVACCTNTTNPHPNCRPIAISEKDPFYSRYNLTCMEFLRTLAGIRPGCALGSRIANNFVTSLLDANFLYGNSKLESQRFRLGEKGLMKTWPKYRDLGLKNVLPPLTKRPEENCIARPRKKFCPLTADTRNNFQPWTVALQIVYIREHNRIAKELGYLNPHWDDERVYQETRHIIAALFQHSTHKELLPAIVGPEFMHMYNLTLQKEGYWYGYEKNLPIGTDIAIQTAAFRFGHTLLHNTFSLYDKHHKFVDSLELHTVIAQAFTLYRPGLMDKIIGGLVDSPIQNFDRFMTSEATKHLFQTPDIGFGLDLASLNINRGRDHAIPGYNDYREWCGLPRAKTFEELGYFLRNSTAFLYSKLYKHPDEIDLWSAAISEYQVEGGLLGPTFACIIANQMSINRRADRYWYENPGFPSSFTPGQLQEIRKVTIAKILCENADDFPTIQMWAMELSDPQENPRYFCKDLPQMNLEFWIEDPNTKEFKYLK